ncbi:flagella synthesis protein FlgN [Shewanella psychrotolerans]|uniref:flagella synthesis protein FlgN n=1 Tax=Shewanella psychrotolerans TaxID=2864206 RepID=UPI001C66146B|nr:flagellar protein FlgN [Shewanella psychrotolerans]QYK00341.1 flagellar protein FlgN [Shewanella psychrotolerans]
MDSITDIITNQHKLLNSLKATIEAEKTALIAQNADQLLAVANDKAKLLDEIKSGDDRLSLHPENAMLKTDETLLNLVTLTQQTLAECKLLNSQNAALIEHSMASINRFSQALQASRNASSLTYDGKGRTSTISTLGNNLKA